MASRPTTTFKKTDKSLERITKAIQRGRLDELVVTGAEKMLEIVKQQCPIKSGQLHESLYIDKHNRPASKQTGWKENEKYDLATRSSVWGAPGFKAHLAVENLYCTIATDLFYAWYVEFGTSRAPPHPFMRPAFDIAARPVADSIKSAFTDVIVASFVA